MAVCIESWGAHELLPLPLLLLLLLPVVIHTHEQIEQEHTRSKPAVG